jgi:hypothetical protein
MFLPHYFEKLKSCVLDAAGLANITPCDCKTISNQILTKTKQRISETTLKRVYGFAYSKFKPSLFTIDVLAHFCGYKSWDDFCNEQEKNTVKKESTSLSWDTLKHNAGKITSFTLQALKNKSGIPYNQTIKRRFIDSHFDGFIEGNYTGTVLSAPAGYGKTIALCHWIDERLELNAKSYTNDIILFFSSNALINVFLSGRDINEWLLALLGYSPEDDVASLLNERSDTEGRFYLIIDGFDEHMFKPEQFGIILNQIVDVFSLYQGHPWFKLVLTMRLASWINYKHEIDNDRDKWFMGFITEAHTAINVPLFNVEEIRELCTKLNPNAQTLVNVEAASKFNHPLYFQFYYKNHKENFSLNYIDHICIYDLISTFILNKVYLGPHSAEKILLLKEMVDEMDFENKNYDISKLKVNNLIKQYNHAYQELLSVGFLRELNESSDLEYNTVIQFSNTDFLEYIVAKKVLLDNNYTFNGVLIKTINTLFGDDDIKLPVLKWAIIYAMKSDQDEGFKILSEVNLTINQKANLVVFLAELFEKECFSAPQSESVKSYVKQNCLKDLFNYFIGIEFIDPEYEKILNILLRFELNTSQKILVHTSLAIVSIIKLDLNKIDEHLQKLKNFSNNDYISFPLNPLNCIDCIYYYLKYGIIKKEFLAEITKFYFNPLSNGNFNDNAANDIVFILAAYTTAICENPRKGLRFINALNKHYKTGNDVLTGYGFFLKIITADRYILLGEIDKAIEIHDELAQIYDGDENSHTPIMKVLHHVLKVKINLFTNKIQDVINQMKYIAGTADKAGYNLTRIYILTFLLRNNHLLEDYVQFEKQLHYDFLKILRECNIKPEIFLQHGQVVRVR